MKQQLSRVFARLFPRWARSRRQRNWERLWSSEDFDPLWGRRGISPEILAALDEGWFGDGPVLDIGCGLGEVAAWFAERGRETVGIDIAAPAIRRAERSCGHLECPPQFFCRDLTVDAAPDRQYRSLVDRGCFHQLPAGTERQFVRQLLSVSAADARLLLFVRAFRNGIPMGDAAEKARQIARVRAAYSPSFIIEAADEAYLDRYQGTVPGKSLPGMVFRLRRVG